MICCLGAIQLSERFVYTQTAICHALGFGVLRRTLTWSKSGWMTPLLGEAFLTSAISPGRPLVLAAERSAPTKSRTGPASAAFRISRAMGWLYRMSSISRALNLRSRGHARISTYVAKCAAFKAHEFERYDTQQALTGWRRLRMHRNMRKVRIRVSWT